MKIINDELFAALSGQAAANPRRRQHLNLHADYQEPCQRLLNAMEPGSYIRPHCHRSDPKPECFLGLRGHLALILFDDEGHIQKILPFGPHQENAGADIPPGVWHTVVSLESGAIFFETKQAEKSPLPPFMKGGIKASGLWFFFSPFAKGDRGGFDVDTNYNQLLITSY